MDTIGRVLALPILLGSKKSNSESGTGGLYLHRDLTWCSTVTGERLEPSVIVMMVY